MAKGVQPPMRRRKAKNGAQGPDGHADGSSGSAGHGDQAAAGPSAELQDAAADPAAEQHAASERVRVLEAASFLAALLLLLAAHRAATRLLAPQTGEWLASSFCSLALFGLAAIAAVAGSVAEEGQAVLAALRDGSGAAPTSQTGLAGASWWAAALSALLLSAPGAAGFFGWLILAPGLADDAGARISDAALTLRSMALAAALAGPLFAALGCAAGAAGGSAVRSLAGASLRSQLLLLPSMAGLAALGMGWGMPAALVPPHPAATLPPLIAAAAAAMAGAFEGAFSPAPPGVGGPAGKKAQQGQRRRPARWTRSGWTHARVAAVLLVASCLALAARRAGAPCDLTAAAGQPARQLEGGRYAVLARCEAAAGGQLAVAEGTYKGQYRYRLLRWDHSVLGGEYVAPADVAGQPIYTAFYLQQAAVLFSPNSTRSLHVGLGVGTAVKAMQRMGVRADSIELVPEVLSAAQSFFHLQPSLLGGRAMVGDALKLVPQLALGPEAAQYDFVLHDVFSGGGIAPALMAPAFFRQLSRVLSPAGGVLAVNYFGGKGQGLKEAWCRLRLAFDHVRAFSDLEKAKARNHVLFASNAVDLSSVNLTAAVVAAHERQAAAAAAGQPEVFDPLQLQVWRSLGRQEVQLTYDRQRCLAMLRRSGAAGGGAGGDGRGRQEPVRPAAAAEETGGAKRRGEAGGHDARQHQQWADQLRSERQGRGGGGRGRQQQEGPPPWVWRQLKAIRERHALATAHWVAMRSQFGDSFWQS